MATTTRTGAGDVVAAIFGLLNVAAITSTLKCGVYDVGVPQDAAFPYLSITTPSGIPFDTFGRAGKERVVQVHLFSQYEGGKELDAIADKVVQLLQDARPTVTGHDLVSIRYEQDTDAGSDAIEGVMTYHKVVQFRVMVQEQ